MKAKGNGFIRLERARWHSDRWRALSANARVVLIDMQCGFTGSNNGAISYGLAHAINSLRCSKSTAIRTLAELQDAGLIEVVVKGSFQYKSGARKGTATEWRLTFLPSNKPAEQPKE